MTEPITRRCRDCGRPFVLEADELALFTRLAREQPDVVWTLPKTCASCRALRRQVRETVRGDEGDLTLRCVQCGRDFEFRSRDREYYASRGFRLPRRCPRCRSAAHSGPDPALQIGGVR